MAVRGTGEGGVVVSDVIPDQRPRPICQHDVISGEAFLDSEGRGGEEEMTTRWQPNQRKRMGPYWDERACRPW